MALTGAILVVADEANDVCEALSRGGNLPMRQVAPEAAADAIAADAPSAVVLDLKDRDPDHETGHTIADALDAIDGPIVPMLAVYHEAHPYPGALPIPAANVATRLVPRLRAALRVRSLHDTVLRRSETQTEPSPEFPTHDPLEDATVLVAGRGRSYPALTMAIGERMGLIGALSFDTARNCLNARDVDAVVIGDGFNRTMVEDFMDELCADPRWRDLPVIVPRDSVRDLDPERSPNVDRLSGSAEDIANYIVPFARMHAFSARLKRIACSLDQRGALAPETGLLTRDAFMDELNRIAATAEKRGAGLSLARLCFDGLANRANLDAARITGRLLRPSDLACRDDDGTILIAFTATDLVTAHVVVRRIASVLKHTTLSVGSERSRLGPSISLAAFRPRDTVDTLLARTIDNRAAVS